eukprot:4473561-Pyramimonas_sp.AAC.1
MPPATRKATQTTSTSERKSLKTGQNGLQEGQDGLQVRPRRSAMASKMAQEGSKMPPSPPKKAQEAPKRPPRRPPRGFPGGPEEAKSIDVPEIAEGAWHLLLLGLPKAQDGPRGPQYLPKMAPNASKMSP